MKKIIYPNETSITVMHPTGLFSVEKTAKRDVPTGVKYKIIEDTDVPEDRTFRDAWDFDFSKDFDGVGE